MGMSVNRSDNQYLSLQLRVLLFRERKYAIELVGPYFNHFKLRVTNNLPKDFLLVWLAYWEIDFDCRQS